MNTALWSKLSILGALVAVGGACAISACTVTEGPISSDDGGTDSSTTTDGGTKDSGGQDAFNPPDTGVDSGVCGPQQTCPILKQFTFENPPNPACGACDECMANNCCAQATACFTPDDSGTADCKEELDCIAACNGADGGASCVDACRQAHQAGDPQVIALDNCRSASCMSQCP